jgi:hypothetical protein
MTQSTHFAAIGLAGLLSTCLWAGPQDAASGGGLEHELLTHFAPTKLDKAKVTKAGAVFTVQKEGIGAISPNGGLSMSRLAGSDQASYPNNYKSGSIKHDMKGTFLASAGSIRDLDVNEKVYVTRIEVKDSSITIGVQSCGTCNPKLPDPEHVPARATVNFQFGKPYLSAATPAQVAEIIEHVFAPAPADAGAQEVSQAPAAAPEAPAPPQAPAGPQAPMAPIPPPPPPVDAPAAPPAEVKMGQTPDQVVAAMGQPQQIFNVGAKMIYKYKSLKITFVNGKVSDVE